MQFFKPYFGISYLKNELKPMFKSKYLLDDIFAGITVACIAIPLSMAIAMASGVNAGIGLISAIIGGILAALFGGTRLAVTGPAAAMSILIASAVDSYNISGLLVIGLICGILQISFGIFRLGRYAKLVPLPVVAAFTAGIGFIILIGQIPVALQLPAPNENHVLDVIIHIGNYIRSMNPTAFTLTIITILILRIIPKFYPKLPSTLIAVIVLTLIVYFFNLKQIKLVSNIPHSLSLPHFPKLSDINDWYQLLGTAITIFALASLETLLSSSAIDNMSKSTEKHNSNQELIGQGIANICTSLFGGIPVTGVIARSSVNLMSGAKTRRSPIIHSLIILGAVYSFPGLIERIPVVALAAILINTSISMMNIREFIHFWKTDRSESLVYLGTFIAIVATDLIQGIKTGIIIAFLIVAIKMLKTRSATRIESNNQVLRVSLKGAITFWSIEHLDKLQSHVNQHTQLKFIIFEFNNLSGIDSSGANHLSNFAQNLSVSGIQIILYKPNEQQQIIIKSNRHNINYLITHNEEEIKNILEKNGIKPTNHIDK